MNEHRWRNGINCAKPAAEDAGFWQEKFTIGEDGVKWNANAWEASVNYVLNSSNKILISLKEKSHYNSLKQEASWVNSAHPSQSLYPPSIKFSPPPGLLKRKQDIQRYIWKEKIQDAFQLSFFGLMRLGKFGWSCLWGDEWQKLASLFLLYILQRLFCGFSAHFSKSKWDWVKKVKECQHLWKKQMLPEVFILIWVFFSVFYNVSAVFRSQMVRGMDSGRKHVGGCLLRI